MTHQPNHKANPINLRPTLIIGLGGTGHRIALRLKSLVYNTWPPDQTEPLIRFLVFDTAQEDLTLPHPSGPIRLEPGHEFHDIGQTPVANIKRHLSRQSAIEERLGGVMANLPPTVLRNGAKQLRPLGLLAFLWRYAEIETHLRDAIWSLAGRQHNDTREGVNVFIVNSLVGGTGSSAFLDVAHVVRDLFDELGTLADFCYITGVGLLPRAFHGVNGPNLIPNAVASLKEINHCMMRGGFTARYPNGRVISTLQPPFNMYYLVDGVDERGHTWSGAGEVCRLAAEAIFLQMASQVGQKHENDFDNLDEVLIQQTEEGDGTFYGSFGLASLYFPGHLVAQVCAARQAARVIREGLLAAPPATTVTDQRVADLIEAMNLEPTQLAEFIARDDQGLPLTVELNTPGWVSRLSPATVPAELIRYVRDYEQARLGVDFKRWLTHHETQLLTQQAAIFNHHLTQLVGQAGLPAAEKLLECFLERVAVLTDQLNTGQTERESQQMALNQELSHLETAFLQAGESGFLGRARRVSRAQHSYLTVAQNLFTLRWQCQITASLLTLLHQLSRLAQDNLALCQATTVRLTAVGRTLTNQTVVDQQALSLAGVTTRTLATPPLVARLFERYASPVADVMASLFSNAASPLDWHNLPPAEIEGRLLAACQPAFDSLTMTSIEAVLTLQADQVSPDSHYSVSPDSYYSVSPDSYYSVSPDSYYTWLSDQATPSWNVDRTRLPEGGAALQRVEVLGVPDEATAAQHRSATTLVSTGDLSRITAFVAHIGAPHTAIQQWDSYQVAYEQARGHVPLHILPQFQADNERARQTFALGSLFNLIKNQGAYFYYIPADPLARPVKLAQGLANSLNTFLNKNGLVQEVRERIDQIVAGRGIEAILRHLRQYYGEQQP